MSVHGSTATGEHADRIRVIADLLVDGGVLTHDDIDEQLRIQSTWAAAGGARMVARAWVDPDYRQRLLTDAKSAATELEVDASAMTQFEVLENTPERHHVIVCTLCSCYPRPVLGQPPDWYKSDAYRARVVREPRAVLEEFGLTLPSDVQIVVVDSSADRRFMVLPVPPRGATGRTEEELAALVTRDSMIGVGQPLPA